MKTTTLLALAALFVNVAPVSFAQSAPASSSVSAAAPKAGSLDEAIAIYDSMPKDCKLVTVATLAGVTGAIRELTINGQMDLMEHPYVKVSGLAAVMDTILTEFDAELSPELRAALTEVRNNAKAALTEMRKLDIEDEANIPELQAIYDRFDEDEALAAKYPESYGKIVAISDYLMEVLDTKYPLQEKSMEVAKAAAAQGKTKEEALVLVFDTMIQILKDASAKIAQGQ